MPGNARSVPGEPTVAVYGSLSHLGRAAAVRRGAWWENLDRRVAESSEEDREEGDEVVLPFGCGACSFWTCRDDWVFLRLGHVINKRFVRRLRDQRQSRIHLKYLLAKIMHHVSSRQRRPSLSPLLPPPCSSTHRIIFMSIMKECSPPLSQVLVVSLRVFSSMVWIASVTGPV